METELKDVVPEHPNPQLPEPAPPPGLTKDDRPLLKCNSNRISAEDLEELEKKFPAFVRYDVYGPMGRGELPFTEKILLGIALLTIVPIRIIAIICILLLYYVVCRVCTAFSIPNRGENEEQEDFAHVGSWRRVLIVQCGRFLSRLMLFVMGFYWISESYGYVEHPPDNSSNQSDGEYEAEEFERPGAIVSNHVSYLDILYHMSSSFPSFVAKRSVAKLPLIGIISKCLGCVYVQRESKASDFKGVSGIVTERVQEAHRNRTSPMMLLFPEGTTTNGDFLLPFKTGAFFAGAPVHPVILRYPYQRFSLAWDSISGARHVFLLLCQFINHLEVTWLPVYHPSKEERDDPKAYANNVRQVMVHEGNLMAINIGLVEKRIYHAALNGGLNF